MDNPDEVRFCMECISLKSESVDKHYVDEAITNIDKLCWKEDMGRKEVQIVK